MTIFSDVAHDWYKQRVLYMYKNKPTCGLVDVVNHLTCSCPTCKDTRFKRSTKFATYVFPYDRLYVFLRSAQEPLQKLQMLQTRFTNIRTNVEFPLPLIKFQSLVHIPEFVDLATKTVIDFLPENTLRTSRIIRRAEATLKPYDYNYVVLNDSGKIIHSRARYTKGQISDMHTALDRLLGAAWQ